MNFGVYSLFDAVAETFGNVTVDKSDAVARRNFASAMSGSGQLQYIAKDLILYKIAEFDVQTGVLVPCVPLIQIAKGVEVLPNDD